MQWVRPLGRAIAARGHSYFLDEEHLNIGSQLAFEIQAAIMYSQILVVICTGNTLQNLESNKWVRREIEYAREREVPIHYVFPGGPNDFDTLDFRKHCLSPSPDEKKSILEVGVDLVATKLSGLLQDSFNPIFDYLKAQFSLLGPPAVTLIKRLLADDELAKRELTSASAGRLDLLQLLEVVPRVQRWWRRLGTTLVQHPAALLLAAQSSERLRDITTLKCDIYEGIGIVEILFEIAVKEAQRSVVDQIALPILMESCAAYLPEENAVYWRKEAQKGCPDERGLHLDEVRLKHSCNLLWQYPESPLRLVLWPERTPDGLRVSATVEVWNRTKAQWVVKHRYEAGRTLSELATLVCQDEEVFEQLSWTEFCLVNREDAVDFLDLLFKLRQTKDKTRKLLANTPLFVRCDCEIKPKRHERKLHERYTLRSTALVAPYQAKQKNSATVLMAPATDSDCFQRYADENPIWSIFHWDSDTLNLEKAVKESGSDTFIRFDDAYQFSKIHDVMIGWEQYPPPRPID